MYFLSKVRNFEVSHFGDKQNREREKHADANGQKGLAEKWPLVLALAFSLARVKMWNKTRQKSDQVQPHH